MRCHACGREFDVRSGERIGFRDECDGCGADLHACRNCEYYDASAYNECREPNAERVSDRERGNRCDYFSPGASDTTAAGAADSRAALEALFKK